MTCLCYRADGTLISGAWDFKVRVWRDGALAFTLDRHQAAVWCILDMQDGRIVSGSADKSICVWEGEDCVQEAKLGCAVRGLVQHGEGGFMACGNDGWLRWPEGSCAMLMPYPVPRWEPCPTIPYTSAGL